MENANEISSMCKCNPSLKVSYVKISYIVNDEIFLCKIAAFLSQ